jgi:uncharacterized protein (DUF1697 family)
MRVAFLRGINVGGHQVRKEVLCEVVAGLGLRDVRTWIASGNVLFDPGDTPRQQDAALEARIDAALEARIDAALEARIDAALEARIGTAQEARIGTAQEARIGTALEALIDTALEVRIAEALEVRLGWAVPTFVRSPAEVAAVARTAVSVLPEPAAGETLQVGFWHRPLDGDEAARVAALATPTDVLHVEGRELYWLSRGPVHKSKVTNARLERAGGDTVTFRNLTTVRRLVELMAPDA